MAVNQQRRKAMKRLAADLEEIQNSPVANVSAAPLDDNMLEWHCNFMLDGTIFHILLFFPENYPFISPSAEFVPRGFNFAGGATKQGKKGTQVCLSIFSDFATWHTEWANEKGVGWSPGYTVQTVLLNMVSFMAEMSARMGQYGKGITEGNAKLAKNFTCKDCGHTAKKPYPPLAEESKGGKGKSSDKGRPDVIDYISKVKLAMAKPKSKDELYGYGLIQSGPPHRPSLTTPCEFLSGESYFGMKKSVGKVQSIMKEDLAFFLPLYIHTAHGEEIKTTLEESMKEVAAILPKCNPKKTPVDEIIMRVIPNLMSATVVEFSKGTQHTSDNHLSGYFSLHRLFLWAIEEYPELQGKIHDKLKVFIEDQANRTKSACPHIGEWLMLLAGSTKYTWQEAAEAYLSESWRRQVMWYVKDDSKLGFLDTDQKYRLEKTLAATAVSRKLLAFQVLFLDIAMPKNMSRADIIKRYDANWGFPTASMVKEMKDACQRIENMKTFDDWFKVLKLKPPSPSEIYAKLKTAVEYSINTNGYHWSWKGMAGWYPVLQKYPNGTPGWKGPPKNKKAAEAGGASTSGAGGAKTAGRGRGGAAKGAGRGKRKADEDEDEDDAPPAKARGRGGKSPARGRGGGRGGKKAAAAMEVDEESESEDEAPAKGRGRGAARGRGGKKPGARGRGRGKK